MEQAQKKIQEVRENAQDKIQEAHVAERGFQSFTPQYIWENFKDGITRNSFETEYVYAAGSSKERYYTPESIRVFGAPVTPYNGPDEITDGISFQYLELNLQLYNTKKNAIIYEHKDEEHQKTGQMFITLEVDEVINSTGPVENDVYWVITYALGGDEYVRLKKTENPRVLLGSSIFSAEDGKEYKVHINTNDHIRDMNYRNSRDIITSVMCVSAETGHAVTERQVYNVQPTIKWAKYNGRYNAVHLLQLFPKYKRLPLVDVSGLVPAKIETTIVLERDSVKTKLSGEMVCVDCKIPEFTGVLKHDSTGKEYTVTFTHYIHKHNNRAHYVWGVKCGPIKKEQVFVGYHDWNTEFQNLVTEVEFEQFKDLPENLNKMNRHTSRWIQLQTFIDMFDSDNFKVKVRVPDLEPHNFYKRIPNFEDSVSELPVERRIQGEKNLYLPMNMETIKTKEVIYSLHRGNINYMKELHDQFKKDGLESKFCLHLFSDTYLKILKQQLGKHSDGKDKIGISSAPRTIFMTSRWLNDPHNSHITIDDNDGQLELVDLQGPIYVSRNGKYMVGPTLTTITNADNTTFQAVTWGVHRWNASTAQYEILGVKMCGERSKYLINETQYDYEQQGKMYERNADGSYVLENGKPKVQLDKYFKPKFDGIYQTFFEFSGKPQQEIFSDVILFHLNPPTNAVQGNPYELCKRFPDYVLPKKDMQREFTELNPEDVHLATEMFRDHNSTEFWEGLDFATANALKLEVATNLLCSNEARLEAENLCGYDDEMKAARGAAGRSADSYGKSYGGVNYSKKVDPKTRSVVEKDKDKYGGPIAFTRRSHNFSQKNHQYDHRSSRDESWRDASQDWEDTGRFRSINNRREKITKEERILKPIYSFADVTLESLDKTFQLHLQTPWDFCTYFVRTYLKWACTHRAEAMYRPQLPAAAQPAASAKRPVDEEEPEWDEVEINKFLDDLKATNETLLNRACQNERLGITRSILSQTAVRAYDYVSLVRQENEIPIAVRVIMHQKNIQETLIFKLKDPYSFHYVCDEFNLNLLPARVDGMDSEETKYIWKITKPTRGAHDAVVAIKTFMPCILFSKTTSNYQINYLPSWTFFVDKITQDLDADALHEKNQMKEHFNVWHHTVVVQEFDYKPFSLKPARFKIDNMTTPTFKLSDIQFEDQSKSAKELFGEYSTSHPDGRMWGMINNTISQNDWKKITNRQGFSSIWYRELLWYHPEKRFECPLQINFCHHKYKKKLLNLKMNLKPENEASPNIITYEALVNITHESTDIVDEEDPQDETISDDEDDSEHEGEPDESENVKFILQKSKESKGRYKEAPYTWTLYAHYKKESYIILEKQYEQSVLSGAQRMETAEQECLRDFQPYLWMCVIDEISKTEDNKKLLNFLYRKLSQNQSRPRDNFSFKWLSWHNEEMGSEVRTHATTGIPECNTFLHSAITPAKHNSDYLLKQCFDSRPAAPRLPPGPRKLAAPVRTFAAWRPAPAPAGVSW